MKMTALAIGCLFLIGGIAGLVNPREWTYTTGSRISATQGPWVISKAGTRALSIGSIAIGLAAFYIGTKNEN